MLKKIIILSVVSLILGCESMQKNISKIEEDGFIEWNHQTEEADILGVSASQETGDKEWSVFINVAEFVREEEDREVWLVEGNINGKELVLASVQALKSIYPELKEYINEF